MQTITKSNFEFISPIHKTNAYLAYNIKYNTGSKKKKNAYARNPEP